MKTVKITGEDLAITEPCVLVELRRYEQVLEQMKWLDALERAGIDNWCGIDYATTLYERTKKGD